jgi:hypothetical protein
MLSSKREAMAAASCAATLAGIGISPASAAPVRAPNNEIDRELRLAISDGFARQLWVNGGGSWTETRDVLAMHEDEIIRVVIFNDTPGVRVISFGDNRPHLRIRPGEMKSLDLAIDSSEPFTIAVVGQPPISRPVKVRANDSASAI